MISGNQKIDLDLIVCGQIVMSSNADRLTIDYENGISANVPLYRDEHIDQIKSSIYPIKKELDALTIRDISEYLSKLGEYWLANNKGSWRGFANAHAPELTGFHRNMLENDYFLFGEFIASKASVYDQVRAELGHEHIFDEWIPVQASYQRAFGLGLAAHILVGNIPLAGLYSVVRSIMARNICLAKLPARDPVSTYALARAMVEIAPDHPITRSISLGYWERNSTVSINALQASDVVVVWGGGEGVRNIAREAAGRPMVIFGPKWSFSVIDLECCDVEDAALRLAFEVGYYDQEACFSSQRVCVRGDVAKFLEALESAFLRFSCKMPQVTSNIDVLAHKTMTQLETEYRVWDTRKVGDFLIVVVPEGKTIKENPLCRTIFVHTIADAEDAAEIIDGNTQTVSVLPWELSEKHRTTWAQAGAERIVELGMSRHPRQGFTHDGMRWLNQLVRITSVERPSGQPYKYNILDKNELPKWLFEKTLS